MPENHKVLYAAACNPPRRVKRTKILPDPLTTTQSSSSSSQPTTSASSPQHQHRPILPMRPYAPREAPSVSATTASGEPVVPPPPAKRGRKPGPLSRTAREAQRRLNHSIIEKARRTKINDALATLKQLVPPNYGQLKQQQQQALSEGNRDEEEEEEEDDEDDDEYDNGAKKKKKAQQQKGKPNAKGQGTGKKEEKEFKLEILVRTVSFLQDLLERVSVLESTPLPSLSAPTPAAPVTAAAEDPAPSSPICPNCGTEFGRASKGREPSSSNPKKRKHIHMDTLDTSQDHHREDPEKAGRHAKIPRRHGGYEDRTLYNRGAADLDVDMARDTDTAPVPVSIPVHRSKAFPDRPHRGPPTDAHHPRSHSSSSPTDRLPPISSWLHNNSHLLNHQERSRTWSPPSPSSTSTPPSINNCVIDPQLLPPPSSSSSISTSTEPLKPSRPRTHSYSSAYNHAQQSYLPSPPGSTHFDPVRSSSVGAPPLLSLGPVAVDAAKTNTKTITKPNHHSGSASSSPDIRAQAGNRTPEDESAASLLLQIASSPTFRAVGSETSSPVFRAVSAATSSSTSTSTPFPSSSSSSSGAAGSATTKRGDGRGEQESNDERDLSVFMLSSSSSDVRSEVVPVGTGRRYDSSERRRHHEHEHEHERERERERGHGEHHQQAQTPSSLLGLKIGMGARRGY